MPLVWKVLVGLLLTLPVGAYFAGSMIGPADAPTDEAPAARSPSVSPVAPSTGSRTPFGGDVAAELSDTETDLDYFLDQGGGQTPQVRPSRPEADQPTLNAEARMQPRDDRADQPAQGTTSPPDDGTSSPDPSPSASPDDTATETAEPTPTPTPDDGSSGGAPDAGTSEAPTQ